MLLRSQSDATRLALGLGCVLAFAGCNAIRAAREDAHEREAVHHVLQSIRVAEEAYAVDAGTYVSISRSLASPGCPRGAARGHPVSWLVDCDGGLHQWGVLPLLVTEPPFERQFTLVARDSGIGLATLLREHPRLPPPDSEPKDWFVVFATDGAARRSYAASWVGPIDVR